MYIMLLAGMLLAQTSSSPYEIDPWVHSVTTVGLFGVMFVGEAVVKPALLGGRLCPLAASGDRCDPTKLSRLDRTVVGNDSHAWLRVSDVGMGLSVLLTPVGSLIDSYLVHSPTPWADTGKDSLLHLESIAVANFMAHTLKYAVRRPRPSLYSPGGSTSVERLLSFPSGHVAATAAACAAYATTFVLRHPHSAWRYVAIGGSVLLTGLTAYGRVGGGMHFYSDVIAGSLLGAGVGMIVPYTNRRMPVQLGAACDTTNHDECQLMATWMY